MALFPSMVYWLAVPSLPRFMTLKNIDLIWVAILLSISATTYLIASMMTGEILLKYVSRINCILIAAVLTLTNLIGVAVLD